MTQGQRRRVVTREGALEDGESEVRREKQHPRWQIENEARDRYEVHNEDSQESVEKGHLEVVGREDHRVRVLSKRAGHEA